MNDLLAGYKNSHMLQDIWNDVLFAQSPELFYVLDTYRLHEVADK